MNDNHTFEEIMAEIEQILRDDLDDIQAPAGRARARGPALSSRSCARPSEERGMTTYRWIREQHLKRGNTWYLAPQGKMYFGQIASVYVRLEQYPKRRLVCSARYHWNSTGNKPEGRAEFGSVAKAKTWCEEQLGAFWEPPEITS